MMAARDAGMLRLVLLINLVLAGLLSSGLAQTLPSVSTPPVPPDLSQHPLDPTAAADTPLYRELDALRRSTFSAATEASVTMRVYHQGSNAPFLHRLAPDAFTLVVNGSERTFRLETQSRAVEDPPLVMLVFPPNQRFLHFFALKDAVKFFGSQPQEVLPWKVAVLDSDGSATPFTNGRTQLFAYLDVIAHKTEPFMLFAGGSTWLSKAADAISAMQASTAPKILIAFNPIPDYIDEGRQLFSQDDPESLTPIATVIGAHIYVARVGAPNSLAEDFRIRDAAQQTQGNIEISLPGTAGAVQRDLDASYTLHFDLTPRDRDRGVPEVIVRVADRREYAVVTDITAVPAKDEAIRKLIAKQSLDKLWAATASPVTSAELQIFQHVDYFPLYGGFQPDLPMSGEVHVRSATPPADLRIAEYLQDTTLNTPVLEREMMPVWKGQIVAWERDGHLRPGTYLWRIVLHDGKGRIYASAQQKVSVAVPPSPALAVSSLIVGKTCREGENANLSTLQKRAALTAAEREQAQFQIDPLRTESCRVIPEVTGTFKSGDRLRAFIRLYPAAKLGKQPPERWSALFTLRSTTGVTSASLNAPFYVDSGSGYIAAIELRLTRVETKENQGTLEVHIKGPGLKKELTVSRAVQFMP